MSGSVRIERSGHVATFVLANPERRNAMSFDMWQQLGEAARTPGIGTEIRAVIVRGEGSGVFCAGADISGFASQRSSRKEADAYDDLVENALRALEAMRCPSIALIHGPCMGAGASIAAACDLRIASTGAFFAVPAGRLGLGYDPRGVARFLRVMGAPATRYLLLSADRLPAERAAEIGAVLQVADKAEAEAAAAKLAATIAGNAPLTLAAAKAALAAHATTDPAAMADAIARYHAADASTDYAEGQRAFAEKRAPKFKGK